MIATIIIGLGGVVIYLLSDINSRHYRLQTAGSTLVVERGRNMPFGFEPYVPKATA